MAVGAAAGMPAGTLAELLAPHGMAAEEAAYYDRHLRRGGVLLWVGTDGAVPVETVVDILCRNVVTTPGDRTTRCWNDRKARSLAGDAVSRRAGRAATGKQGTS